jgi:hypothetical protein
MDGNAIYDGYEVDFVWSFTPSVLKYKAF